MTNKIDIAVTHTISKDQATCQHDFNPLYRVCDKCLITERVWYFVKDHRIVKNMRKHAQTQED